MYRKRAKCVQCGVCCVSCTCEAWGDNEGEDGICKALIIHEEGYTSCKNIARESSPFPNGCLLRTHEELFENLKEIAESRAGVKLLGKGEK